MCCILYVATVCRVKYRVYMIYYVLYLSLLHVIGVILFIFSFHSKSLGQFGLYQCLMYTGLPYVPVVYSGAAVRYIYNISVYIIYL